MLFQVCIIYLFFVINAKEDILENVGNHQTAAVSHWLP